MRLVIATTIMWLVAGPAGAQHPAIDHEVERLVPQITALVRGNKCSARPWPS